MSLYKSAICDIIANSVSCNSSTISKDDLYKFCSNIQYMLQYYDSYEKQLKESAIIWDHVKPVPKKLCLQYSDLKTGTYDKNLLSQCAILKLNGGLGTTMGCSGPKALINVRDGVNFLEAIVQQLYDCNNTNNCNIPLVLMNSFNTQEETSKYLKDNLHDRVTVLTFLQNEFLRINSRTGLPLAKSLNASKDMFYPPGHGDIFASLQSSGMLDRLLNMGIKYIFVSNIDNLGATFDIKILEYMHSEKKDYVMEVTDKTINDVKGGNIIEYNGILELLEIAQVPKENIDDFYDINKFRVFNTNNIWINLETIKSKLTDKSLNLDVIINKKMHNGIPIIQLETAIGSAIKIFENSCCINVPRNRFHPVKSCIDLFLLRSCFYELKNGYIKKVIDRPFPVIDLPEEYKSLQTFDKYVKYIPDIKHLNKLSVKSGYVKFSKPVSLIGNIILNIGNDSVYEMS